MNMIDEKITNITVCKTIKGIAVQNGNLEIEFHDDSTRLYENIPDMHYLKLKDAVKFGNGVGKYYRENIKNVFPYIEMKHATINKKVNK
jgi:hypothetical protein